MKLKWTKDHKSVCGRFWCYKAPRSDTWQLWDSLVKDTSGNDRRYYLRTLKEAKEKAQWLTDHQL